MDNFKGNRMVNIPDKFGTNLPASYKNLVGVSASDFGGYDNMPQYLKDLLMSSQVAASDAAAGASSPASPTAAAQGAGGISSDAALGRMLYNQALNPYYSSPIRGGRMFTSSFGGNGATDSDFALLARMQGLTPYERALIGTEGGRALDAGKALTQRLSSGITNPASAMGLGLMKTWGTSPAAAVTPAATTEEAKPATQTAASTGLANNPYVLNQTPEAMKYAKGGSVNIEKQRQAQKESDEIKRLIQQQEEGVAEQERRARDIENLNEHDYEERKKEDIGDMWPHYAQGGLVEMGEELRDKGRMGDSILAHISPDEARMLKMMGGAGTINPETGLPEYFSFKKLLGAALPIIGNAIAPGIGGILGGAAGGVLSGGGLEGALMGAAGAGLGNLGGSVFGGAGGGGGGFGLGNLMNGLFGGSSQGKLQGGADYDDLTDDQRDFMETEDALDLLGGGKGGMDWKKAAALGGLGLAGVGAYYNRNQGKKNDKMLREQEAERQRKQDEENKSFRELIESQQPRTFTPAPADYYTYGNRPEHKYFNDYGPISMPTRQFAGGGYVGEDGLGGGQDDTIPARLSNNEYVIPADVVAHLGDGTPKQGAKKLDKMIGNVRKHKAVKGHPPKSKPVKAYVGGLG